jgi:hypothetical protein
MTRALKSLFLPHAGNHYRPHLIRRAGLAVIVLALIALQWPLITQPGEVLGDRDITAAAILADTNQARDQDHLTNLSMNAELTRAAEQKANDMLTRGYWSHNAPDGTTPWAWIKAQNYQYATAGENLARGFADSAAVVAAWLNSPEHRANLLDAEFSDVGIAVKTGQLEGKMTTLVVALYAAPASQTVIGQILGDATSTPAVETDISWAERMWRGLHSFARTQIISLAIIAVAAAVALVAHLRRGRLPEELRTTWYRHHGLVKFGFFAVLAIGVIWGYGGGLI